MRWISGIAAIVLSGSMALAVDGGRVWVAPFAEANDAGQAAQANQPDWISRALHQSVVDDLASIRGVSVANAAPAAPAANAPTTRPSDVDYVISGTIQRVDGELRVTGRVEDVATNKTVGGFKATGGERDLFAIEDSIASQLKSAIAPSAPAPGAQPAGPATAGAPNASSFDGSDLQRALDDRDYLRRLQQNGNYQPPADYGNTQPVNGYYQPTSSDGYGPAYWKLEYSPFLLGGGRYYYTPYFGGYPGYYNSGYYNSGYYGGYGGYGGYGWGGGSNIVIINGGRGRGGHWGGGGGHWNGGGGHGNGGGGGSPAPAPGPNIQAQQMQAIRNASSWAGNPPSTEVHTMQGPQLVPGGGTPRGR